MDYTGWNVYDIELTDTFGGEANYSWVRRARIRMRDLAHYGYTGGADGSFAKASRTYRRELMRHAKAAVGMTGARGTVEEYGDCYAFRPYGLLQVMFVTYNDAPAEESER